MSSKTSKGGNPSQFLAEIINPFCVVWISYVRIYQLHANVHMNLQKLSLTKGIINLPWSPIDLSLKVIEIYGPSIIKYFFKMTNCFQQIFLRSICAVNRDIYIILTRDILIFNRVHPLYLSINDLDVWC